MALVALPTPSKCAPTVDAKEGTSPASAKKRTRLEFAPEEHDWLVKAAEEHLGCPGVPPKFWFPGAHAAGVAAGKINQARPVDSLRTHLVKHYEQ